MNLENLESKSDEKLKKLLQDLGGWPILMRHWNETDFHWGKIVEKCIEHGLYYDWFIYIENEIAYNSSNENLHVRYSNNYFNKYQLKTVFLDKTSKSRRDTD